MHPGAATADAVGAAGSAAFQYARDRDLSALRFCRDRPPPRLLSGRRQPARRSDRHEAVPMSEVSRRSVFLDEIGLGAIWLRREGVLASTETGAELADVSPPVDMTVAAPAPTVAMSDPELQPYAVPAPETAV